MSLLPLIWFKILSLALIKEPVNEILWNLNHKQNLATSSGDIDSPNLLA